MKCSPFSDKFMLRRRARHFRKHHLRGHHYSSMFHGMKHDHHQRHRMGRGDFGHHKSDHGSDKHLKMEHHHHERHHDKRHIMGHHHLHHDRHHRRHPKMSHFKRRQLEIEIMRDELDDVNALPEINEDGSPFFAPMSKSQVTKENDKFQICLDTSHYQPSQVSVKIIGNKIEVSALHKSVGGDWFEFHEMHRSIDVPDDVNPDSIISHLDSDGKLTIEATINAEEGETANPREIPVIQVDE